MAEQVFRSNFDKNTRSIVASNSNNTNFMEIIKVFLKRNGTISTRCSVSFAILRELYSRLKPRTPSKSNILANLHIIFVRLVERTTLLGQSTFLNDRLQSSDKFVKRKI